MSEENKRKLLPFGFQQNPHLTGKAAAMGNMYYSMGFPVWSRDGGGYLSIYQDQFNKNLRAGKNPFEGFPAHMIPDGMGGNNPGSQQPAPPAPRQIQWSFPQYSQAWAFTPPTAPPVNLPPVFKKK